DLDAEVGVVLPNAGDDLEDLLRPVGDPAPCLRVSGEWLERRIGGAVDGRVVARRDGTAAKIEDERGARIEPPFEGENARAGATTCGTRPGVDVRQTLGHGWSLSGTVPMRNGNECEP